ncbi:MAG TPA: NAD-dependent epimerase/dehydratase family protein [Bryobacteraceae bacterium]|jgi:CDP-paratose 2-epimerase|nr:NAD-dependent epimerase/dehydratase family protein [Bryobacteraceae bacterium]
MKVLITGACGFVGSRLAEALAKLIPGLEIVGFDNLLRAGSETNRAALTSRGMQYVHGDVRMRSDMDAVPSCDWIIDAAANPSVLAGVDGRSSSRQLSEHNLAGTLNMLEYCRERKAGLVLLSTSRVYSVRDLAALPMRSAGNTFCLDDKQSLCEGVSAAGITESFPARQPISLYGATKLSSEIMAIEYGLTFGFPVWINRCGVLAGAGQFGTAEQGIFSYWLHAHAARLPLRYIGFGGRGFQVRDAFHPEDLAALLALQLRRDPPENPIYNVSGGGRNAMSLAQLTAWCDEQFGRHQPQPDVRPRPFDIPWLVMDHARTASDFGWSPERSITDILTEITAHVRANPGWLNRTGAV